jgi:hypothetical protein
MCMLCIQSMKDKESSDETVDAGQEGERKRVTVTLPKSVHDMAKQLAKEDRRDLSHFVEVLIEQAAERKSPATEAA